MQRRYGRNGDSMREEMRRAEQEARDFYRRRDGASVLSACGAGSGSGACSADAFETPCPGPELSRAGCADSAPESAPSIGESPFCPCTGETPPGFCGGCDASPEDTGSGAAEQPLRAASSGRPDPPAGVEAARGNSTKKAPTEAPGKNDQRGAPRGFCGVERFDRPDDRGDDGLQTRRQPAWHDREAMLLAALIYILINQGADRQLILALGYILL